MFFYKYAIKKGLFQILLIVIYGLNLLKNTEKR